MAVGEGGGGEVAFFISCWFLLLMKMRGEIEVGLKFFVCVPPIFSDSGRLWELKEREN